MKVRRHFLFYGRVQFVGFRWRAFRHAESLGISGWCRNLADGTVELEAEADEGAIRLLVERMKGERFIEITKIDEADIPLCGGDSFEIR